MEITREEIVKASEENAGKFVDRYKNVGKYAFIDGAEWVLSLIEQKMKEV